MHIAAALLDNSIKHLKTVSKFLNERKLSNEDFLKQIAAELDVKIENDTTVEEEKLFPKKRSRLNSKLEVLKKFGNCAEMHLCENFSKEVKKNYMGLPITSECLLMDPLQWLKKIKFSFHFYQKSPDACIVFPPTAAPIEPVWSASGLTITNQRSQLSPTIFNILLFVHENYRFVKCIALD